MGKIRVKHDLDSGKRVNMLLVKHFENIENTLLQQATISSVSGHTNHKGTPREKIFWKFLTDHLGDAVGIGTGELIDQDSRPGESRNQHDIVIYNKKFPQIDFGGDIKGFLAESVMAIIEVKSLLTKEQLKIAMLSAHKAKITRRNLVIRDADDVHIPGLASYIVAYDGPQNMKTVYNWIKEIQREQSIPIVQLQGTQMERINVAASSIDAVIVLGKGFVHFDNTTVSFFNPEMRQQNPKTRWLFADQKTGSLLLFFLFLMDIIGSYDNIRINPLAYLKGWEVDNLIGGE